MVEALVRRLKIPEPQRLPVPPLAIIAALLIGGGVGYAAVQLVDKLAGEYA